VAINDVARVYASSLAELGKKNDSLEQYEEEIKFVADLVSGDSNLRNFFLSPGISRETKKIFLNKVFKNKLSDDIIYFLCVLIDNERQSSIGDMYDAMTEIVDNARNRQKATVTTCDGLDGSTIEKITGTLRDVFKKEIIINEQIDKGILGGIVIKVGDLVIDGSLARGLKNIRNSLLKSKVRSELAYED